MLTVCPKQVLKPFPIAKKWAMRVTNEFFLQGDQENLKQLPLTPMCDRGSQGRVALQKGFIDFVIGVSHVTLLPPKLSAGRVAHPFRHVIQ